MNEKTHAAQVVYHITNCQSALYAYICSLLGTSAGAADVLQETNLVLWEKAAEYDAERPFQPWAYKFAYFQVLAYRKRRSRDRLVFSEDVVEQISQAFLGREGSLDEELDALGRCLEKIPAAGRALLEARYAKGQSVNDIAAARNKGANAVAAELYRLRKLLLECIGRQLGRGGESGGAPA